MLMQSEWCLFVYATMQVQCFVLDPKWFHWSTSRNEFKHYVVSLVRQIFRFCYMSNTRIAQPRHKCIMHFSYLIFSRPCSSETLSASSHCFTVIAFAKIFSLYQATRHLHHHYFLQILNVKCIATPLLCNI